MDGCSVTSMYNRLKSLGTTMRSRSNANKLFPDSVFVKLYNVGLSASQVGRILGVDSSTVIKRLHMINFPLRSRRVASQIRYTEEEFRRYFMVPDVLGRITESVS
jgi:transposase-like protein